MSEKSPLLSGSLRLLVMLAIVTWLLLQISSGDFEKQSRQQAKAFDLDEEGLVRSLHVSSQQFDTALLPQLSRLRKLTITDRTVDRALAEQIAATAVRTLILERCKVLPDAVAVLKDGLPELTELSLVGSDGSGDLSGLLTIPCRLLDLTSLRWVTDDQLVILARHQPELESVKLARTGVSGAAGSILSRCVELTELDVSNCALGGPEFATGVQSMCALRNLNVCGAAITLPQLRVIQKNNPKLRLLFAPKTYPELDGVRSHHATATGLDDGVRLFASVFERAVVYDDGDGLRFDGLRWLPGTTHITFSGAGVTDRKVAFVQQMPQLRSLNFAGTSITDSTLQRIVRLAHLTALDLSGTQATDEGIALLKKLPNLKEADLADTRLTDAGLQKLTAANNLRHLDISGTLVSAAGLQWLVDLPHPPRVEWSGLQISEMSESLERRLPLLTDTLEVTADGDLDEFLRPGLRFSSASIEDAVLTSTQIATLATWPELQSLELDNCRFADDLPDLSSLAKLRWLHLTNCGLTDETMKSISMPVSVTSLDLSGNAIRDFVLKTPKPLTLRSVDLSETQASVSSIRQLLISDLESLNVRGVDFGEGEADLVPLPDTLRLSRLTLSLDKSSVDTFSRLGVLQRLSALEVHVDDPATISHSVVVQLLASPQLFQITVYGSQQTCARMKQMIRATGFRGDYRCRID